MRQIILFIFLLGLSGCGFVFQNFGQGEDKGLTYGMSQEEVIAKIGQPQKTSKLAIDNREYDVWEYPNNNGPRAEKINELGIIYSKVFFFDGKLVQRDKDRVYGQPAYEYLESINPEDAVKATEIVEQKDNLK
jgi:hypothetical protein